MRKLRNTKNILLHTSAVFAIVFLAAIFASSALAPVTSSNAAETKLTANVSYAVHTLSITAASSITLDVNARPSGAMTVAASNINMNTSSPNGYKLYLGMNSNTADLLRNGNEQATRLKAVSGTFADPASMEETSSTWGYALASASAAEGNGFDGSYTTGEDLTPTTNKFASLPTNNQAPQLVIESDKASAASGDDYNIYYAVNASYDTPTGTYSNQVVYTAIADGGSGHAMTINPSQTSNTAGGDKINVITTLYGTATSFTGTVYMLTADERAAVNNNTPITNYANRALTCDRDTSAETLQYSCTTPANALGTYYVVVDVPEYNERYEKAFSYVEATFWNISTMQQMTPALCASVTTPSASATLTDTTGAFHGNNAYVPQRTLYDVRDANAYTIRKLADGNCWMTENLALVGPFTPTSEDSNVKSTSEFALTGSDTSSWCTTDSSDCDDKSMAINTGTTYGVLYNWYAATAGTGTYSLSSGNAESSICPKGWRLPTGGSSSEFNTLYTSYGSSATNLLSETGPAFVLSGHRNGSSTSHQGSNGDYWSSTANNSTYAHDLYMNSSDVNPANRTPKYYGFSVRCIADDSTPGTLTVTPDTIDADTATTVDVSIPLSGDYNANISLGDTALTCSRTSTSPLSFSCNVPSTTSGTYTLTASLPSYGKTYSGSLEVVQPGPSLFDLTTMQELADYPSLCTQATTPNADATLEDTDGSHHGDANYVPTVTLLDDRTDGTANTKYSYRIRKLADGKCWMTQNLRLTNATLTSDDSNLTTISSYALKASSTGGWCTSTDSSCINTENVLDSGNADYGVYYSWASAIAGTPNADSISTRGTLAPNSICPKGWHLPSSYITNSDFQTLYNQYNSADKMRSYGDYATLKGPGFVLSGYRYGSNTYSQGTYSYYWSSTAGNAYAAYYLNLDSSSVYPANSDYKYCGFTVRCVAE